VAPDPIHIPADLLQVRRLAEAVRRYGSEAGLPPVAIDDLELAVVEAANNIVIHGYEGGSGQIEMRLTAYCGLWVELRDRGRAIPPETFACSSAPQTSDESGRGMAIIRACVDETRYRSGDGINRLTLFKAAV
jgi:serine/threonine-protein kinase RsbW